MAEAAKAAQAATGQIEASEFDKLMTGAFKPKTDSAAEAIKQGAQTLAEQALATSAVVSDDAVKTIQAIIAEIDKKLSEQVNAIIHHEEFRTLEGTWRGLHYLVNNTETDETLKIRVMNISKKDLGKTLKKFKGTAWDQSPLFKKFYEEEFGTPRPTAASSATIPSITRLRTWKSCRAWRRSRLRRTRRLSRAQRRRC